MKQSNPIILIHGFWDQYKIFNCMAKTLEMNGFEVHYKLNLTPNNGKYGIEALANQLQEFINKHTRNDEKVDIVAFSMGGIVSRYFIQKLSTTNKVDKLITIASPHYGTHVARLFNYKACQQMRPNSYFLNDLNLEIDKLKAVKVTSIWAKYDTTIIPNSSSILPIGNAIMLPFGIHPLLPSNKKVIEEVLKALKNDT